MSWSTTLKNRQQIRAHVEAGEQIAVMFSDIRGFTSYTARKGDRAAYNLSRAHDLLLRERIEEGNGIVVKTLGDGIMAAFPELSSAVEAAIAIQRRIRERNAKDPSEVIDVGIGLASGTPIVTESDIIGNSVNLSQRVSSLAKGGQILTTEEFAREATGAPGARFIPLGERELKGVGRIPLYEVMWMAEVARLTDRDDRLTLLLTERGTLVAKMAKEVRAADRRSGRASILQRGIARVSRAVLDKSLASAGIAREQPIDRVDIAVDGDRVSILIGKKEICLHNVDNAEAVAFRDKLVQMRKELYPEKAST